MLTSVSASIASGAVSQETPPRAKADALLTRTSASRPPSALSTASRWLMSSASGRQPVSSASTMRSSAERATAQTSRPPMRNWRTIAAPMPRLAPVTMAVR